MPRVELNGPGESELYRKWKRDFAGPKATAESRIIELFKNLKPQQQQSLRNLVARRNHDETGQQEKFRILMPGSGVAYGLPQLIKELRKIIGPNVEIDVALIDPHKVALAVAQSYLIAELGSDERLNYTVAQMTVSEFLKTDGYQNPHMIFQEHPSTSFEREAEGLRYDIPACLDRIGQGAQILVMRACYKRVETEFLDLMDVAAGEKDVLDKSVSAVGAGLVGPVPYKHIELHVLTRGPRSMQEFTTAVARNDLYTQAWPRHMLLLAIMFNAVGICHDYADDGIDDWSRVVATIAAVIFRYGMNEIDPFVPSQWPQYVQLTAASVISAAVGSRSMIQSIWSAITGAQDDVNTVLPTP